MRCSHRGYVCRDRVQPTGVETIAACGEGQLQKALRTLQLLDRKRLPVSRDVIYSLLQECIKHRNFDAGATIHTLIVSRGLDHSTYFADHLIRLFASCGRLSEANHVFKNVRRPTAHTWNAIIFAHVSFAEHEGAFGLYQKMLQDTPDMVDSFTLSCILKACSALGAVWQGRVIHGYILEENFDNDIVIMNTLVDMYSKICSMEDAQAVFDGLGDRNLLSWGAIISGYSEQGNGIHALELFAKMQSEGLQPSRAILLSVLKACNAIGAINAGRKIHDQIIRLEFGSDSAVLSALVNMYAKCRSLDEAYAVFSKCQDIDIVMWGAMIAGFMENRQGQGAFETFKKMQESNVEPNTAVFISLLKACTGKNELKQGMLVHEQIRKADLNFDVAILAALIDMYSNCGSLEKAQEVFDNILDRDNVIWVSMIAAYVQHGHKDCAMDLYGRMIAEGTRLNAKTFASLLKVCSNGASGLLWLIHDNIIRSEHQVDVVIESALVDMYGKCGFIEEAQCVFERLSEQNVMSWGGLIAGYVQQGLESGALALFNTMLEHGLEPDRATLSCILRACCGGAGSIKQGREIHDLIIRNRDELDAIIISSLVDLYAKWGRLGEACKVFDGATAKDAISWGVIISSCCLHGNLNLAIQYLNAMEEQGVRPVNTIFTSLLTACCHAGNLEEGYRLFKSMTEDYGIVPDGEHYSCMMDLMSRTGGLSDAQELFQSIPYEYDPIMGTSLLMGCRLYCKMEIGNQCFVKVF